MNKKSPSLKKNLVYNIIYQITITILPLITTPYLSRIVGAEGIGIYSYYHSIAAYFVYFAMLGISNYGNRSIAKSKNQKEINYNFSKIYIFQIITSISIILLYFVYSLIFIKDYKLIGVIFSLQVISSLFDVSWVFFGLQEFKITATRQIIIRLLAFVSMFVFVKSYSDLWIYTIIMCLSTFFSAFTLWILLWKRVKFVKIEKKDLINMIKPILILFVPIIATSVYRVMDKIMIGMFCNMKDVGYYENSEKLITISLGIISSFGAVMMPKISSLLSENKREEVKKLFDLSMEFALLMGVAIAFGILSVSKEFVPIFFGDEFKPSINYSMLLTMTVPFISWAAIIRLLFLIPSEKDKIYVKSVLIGACLNFTFNIILINFLGVYGAIVATIIAESSVAIYQTIKTSKSINYNRHLKEAVIFFSFGIVMFIFVRLFASISSVNILNLILEIFLGAITYIILSIIYLYLSKNEIFMKYLNKILKKIGISKLCIKQ